MQKIPDQNQHPFVIKSFSKLESKNCILNLIIRMYEKSMAHILMIKLNLDDTN